MLKSGEKFRRPRGQHVQEFVYNNFSLDHKIKTALSGLMPNTQWLLTELPTQEDKELIADFILNWPIESEYGYPMSPNTKKAYVQALVYLSRYLNYKKSFREMKREDIVDGYLNSLRKTFEEDSEQKWVSTYNTRAACYLAFWKWLTQPEMKREQRQTPPQMKGWRAAKKKAKTSTRREHMWTDDEHRVFLKYCEDLRLACYHAIAKETGGRPRELLALKISDLQFRTSPSTGAKYAEFTIGDKVGGKMKQPRPVSIADAIPYYNIWVSVHPKRDSSQGAYLFPSRENKAKYRNIALDPDSLRQVYVKVLTEQFPKLLEKPDVSLEDKAVLKGLIYDKKKHRPYLRRHELATEIFYKVPLPAFKQIMGHSKTSRTYEVYVHELGDEGNKELLIAKGIIKRGETITEARQELQAKQCHICHEPNKHNADFCFRCNWVISKKGMLEVQEKDAAAIKEAEQTKTLLEATAKELAELRSIQEKAAKKQQTDIDEIKAKLEKGEGFYAQSNVFSFIQKNLRNVDLTEKKQASS